MENSGMDIKGYLDVCHAAESRIGSLIQAYLAFIVFIVTCLFGMDDSQDKADHIFIGIIMITGSAFFMYGNYVRIIAHQKTLRIFSSELRSAAPTTDNLSGEMKEHLSSISWMNWTTQNNIYWGGWVIVGILIITRCFTTLWDDATPDTLVHLKQIEACLAAKP